MSSKLKKWYVILGLTLGGLAVCFLLVMAGGLAGGMAGYMAAHRGGVVGLLGPWVQVRPLILQREQAPEATPQVPQPWQTPPEATPQAPQPWQTPPDTTLLPYSVRLRWAVVAEVDADGPAEEAGLETGDIIIAVDDKAMGEDRDLAALITGHKPDDEIVVTIVRPGDDPELMNLDVTLGSDTNAEGEEVAHLGLKYRMMPSGMGFMMPMERNWSPGGEGQTY